MKKANRHEDYRHMLKMNTFSFVKQTRSSIGIMLNIEYAL